MKKVFITSELNNMKPKYAKLERPLIIGFVQQDEPETKGGRIQPGAKVFWKQNLDFFPGGKLEYDHVNDEVTLRFKVRPNEYLAIGDSSGKAEKEKIKGVHRHT